MGTCVLMFKNFQATGQNTVIALFYTEVYNVYYSQKLVMRMKYYKALGQKITLARRWEATRKNLVVMLRKIRQILVSLTPCARLCDGHVGEPGILTAEAKI